ncbi:hypothetical protein MBLNU230_g5689t1 [Neophaeotheca triangularis]
MPGNIASIPESVIAQWPEPNYEDPETRTWLPALAVMMLFLSTVFVAIRMSLRWKKIGGNFGLDDAFLIPAWLCAVAFAALASYSKGDENGLARTESGTQAEISTSPHSTKQWLANEQYGIAL